jgi:hypothetical protein
MPFRPILVPLVLASLIGGCASVIEGTTQPIAISTTPEIGATCTASNANGEWSVVTPATITVKKSRTALKIQCSKPAWQDATFYAVGKWSKAGFVGELVPYVGLINYAVDTSTGAMMVYPSSATIPMKPEPSLLKLPPPPKHLTLPPPPSSH